MALFQAKKEKCTMENNEKKYGFEKITAEELVAISGGSIDMNCYQNCYNEYGREQPQGEKLQACLQGCLK